MAVFGEESLELNIFKGYSASKYHRKKDYCSDLINFVSTGDNEYTLREDFVLLQELTQTISVIGLIKRTPMNLARDNIEIFTASGSATADAPTLIHAYYHPTGPVQNVTWLTSSQRTPTNYTQDLPANRGLKAFCQYKDRYYASNGATHIFRVSNFVTTPATPLITTDLLTLTGGVDQMISFKNRIFGIKGSRIYYTDLPAIGGYPETWDANLNFIEMPTTDLTITILNMIPYRDKLYLFTDRGIYYLLANGDIVNWSVQLVSSDFYITDRDCVCLNRNLIFLTDQVNVWTFDGTKFTNVSGPIKEIFYNSANLYFLCKVYPYEDGVILYREEYSDDTTNYTFLSAFTDRLFYYYDLNQWTTLQVPNTGNRGVLRIGTNFLPYRGKYPGSYIYYMIAGGKYSCVFLDAGNWAGDAYTTNHAAARTAVNFSITGPYPFLDSKTFKRYKKAMIYGYFNIGSTAALTICGEVIAYTTLNNTNDKLTVMFGSASFGKDTQAFTLVGNASVDKTVGKTQPPLIITGISIVYNSNNREPGEQKVE